MKQLIVNNKLNMDICVLLGCYERENQEEYYGTFDECVAEMLRLAMKNLECNSEAELRQTVEEDMDGLLNVDPEDMTAQLRCQKYGENHDWVIRHLAPVDAGTAVNSADYIKDHALKAEVYLLAETYEQNIQEPWFSETFQEPVEEMKRRAMEKLNLDEDDLGEIGETDFFGFCADEASQTGKAWGEYQGNNVDMDISWLGLVRLDPKSFVGKWALFDTHGGDSAWNARCGQKVKVLRALPEEEADIADVGPMYRIMFEDGTETGAFEDELSLCD